MNSKEKSNVEQSSVGKVPFSLSLLSGCFLCFDFSSIWMLFLPWKSHGQRSLVSQRVGHDLETKQQQYTLVSILGRFSLV